MKSIHIVEVYGYTEWAAATYVGDDGQEYMVTITKNYSKDVGYEEEEIVNITQAGNCIGNNDPIWKEVKLALNNKKSPRRSSNSEQGHSKS